MVGTRVDVAVLLTLGHGEDLLLLLAILFAVVVQCGCLLHLSSVDAVAIQCYGKDPLLLLAYIVDASC